MSQVGDVGEVVPWKVLFTPAERVGWVYTDRDDFRAPFDVPEPDVRSGPDAKTRHESAVEAKLRGRFEATWKAAAVGVVLGLLWWARGKAAAGRPITLGGLFGAAVGMGVLAGLAWCALIFGHRRAVRGFWDWRRAVYLKRVQKVYEGWERSRSAFEQSEHRRLAGLSEWSPVGVAPGCRRVDVIGGNLWGWEAFLTVFGSSTLVARGPMAVIDLSGEIVVRELVRGAMASGLTVDFQLLPTELAESDLLYGMDTGQLVEAFVESLHGGKDDADRGGRGLDARVLTEICEVIAPGGLTMARIAASARVLMNQPVRAGEELSSAERTLLADELFSEDYRSHVFETLSRIDAMAHPLGRLGARREMRDGAQLRCVSASSDWGNASADFLSDLLVAWAARSVADGAGRTSTLVIAGADRLAVRHIERLSDLCDRRNVRLVTMFRHLRETSLRVLGAGPVGFMKLGNFEEAARAADYIGREYKFELSQLTHTTGGDESHSVASGEGASGGQSTTRGREQGGSRRELFEQRSRSWGKSDSQSWNTERNWNRTLSDAHGTNWSNAKSRQRVYEHTVEPRVMQQLPDYAMVLTEHLPTGVRVRALDINPETAVMASMGEFGQHQADAPTDDISGHRYTSHEFASTQHPQVEAMGTRAASWSARSLSWRAPTAAFARWRSGLRR